MRKIFITFIFLAVVFSGHAQVHVTVKDHQTGNPLEGVTVAHKTGYPVITNNLGVVELAINKFPATLTVTYVGFKTQELKITQSGEVSIVLEADVTQLNDIVVTGQFEPQSVRQSVYQVRTISNERITLRSPVNVQGVLSTELGIRFSNDLTLGTADITLMGMNGRNVKILVDGIPLVDRGDTRESLNQIDVNSIERIEIVDGPMSVIYGTDALAGVINVITKKYDNNTLTIDARVHEETAAKEYDFLSGKGVHNESINVNWGANKFSVGAGITRNTHGGWKEGRPYFAPNLPVPYSEWRPKDQWMTNATLGYTGSALNVWYRLNYLNESINSLGNAAVPGQTIFVDQDYITQRFNHQVQAEWEITNRWSFNGAASYQDLSRKTVTTNFNSTTGKETLSVEPGSQSKAMFDMAMLRGFFLYKLSPKISLQPGFEVNYNKGSGDRIDRERSIADYAGFVSVEFKPTENINIRPGLRFIYNDTYEAPPVIPSLNAKVTLGKAFDIRFAYAHGFRSPALRELYFYFYDASHAIEGNPDLKAEYSNSFSSSLTWNFPTKGVIRTKSTLTSFYNLFNNLIDLAQYDGTTTYKYYNVLKHRTAGATLENNVYWKNLSFTVGGSYIGRYNDFSEDDTALPSFIWNTEINAVASYQFEKWRTTVAAYYKFTGKRQSYFISGEDVRLGEVEGFHLLDASVSQPFLKYLTLTVGAKNILDVTQLQNTSQASSGSGPHTTSGNVQLGYGRSYFATLAVRWSK